MIIYLSFYVLVYFPNDLIMAILRAEMMRFSFSLLSKFVNFSIIFQVQAAET